MIGQIRESKMKTLMSDRPTDGHTPIYVEVTSSTGYLVDMGSEDLR